MKFGGHHSPALSLLKVLAHLPAVLRLTSTSRPIAPGLGWAGRQGAGATFLSRRAGEFLQQGHGQARVECSSTLGFQQGGRQRALSPSHPQRTRAECVWRGRMMPHPPCRHQSILWWDPLWSIPPPPGTTYFPQGPCPGAEWYRLICVHMGASPSYFLPIPWFCG